jgi:hypothetical protein
MAAIVIAKRRARSRRGQAGEAMFIVAMTLAVLASVGIYALAAAAMEVRTSGNERQNTQTHYLAEYGIIGAAHELVATKAQWVLGLMLTVPDSCPLSLPGVDVTVADPMSKACRRVGSLELGTQLGTPWSAAITVPYTGTQPFAASTPPGSFGPTPMSGDFFIEVTDPAQANTPARYALGLNFCFIGLTVTSSGITQPLYPDPKLTPDATRQFAGEGIEVQRARLIAGPIQCPK